MIEVKSISEEKALALAEQWQTRSQKLMNKPDPSFPNRKIRDNKLLASTAEEIYQGFVSLFYEDTGDAGDPHTQRAVNQYAYAAFQKLLPLIPDERAREKIVGGIIDCAVDCFMDVFPENQMPIVSPKSIRRYWLYQASDSGKGF